jgi:tetratricopeptide (TPR) repeat protein
MALGDRKDKTLPADALTGASTALLGDLAREPGLALQVWRALIHSGDRDQAYLLLHGLAADHPRILDFRFLLARHEIGDGRLADAAKSLDALVAESPGDSDLLLAALNVALERGDLAAAHALAMSSFDGGDSPLARRVAATLALERGRLAEAAVATGDGADLSTAEARALAGLAARVAAERGDPDAAARAEAVLAADPAEPSAWIARVVACARPGGAAATAALDRLVAEKLDATDPLDELELVTLAERCRDVGAAAAAESLALRALVRAPRHAAAELVLADSLLLQSRWDDALRLLTAPTPTAATPHGLMRATLALGARDGALPAWEWLRDRTRLGESERAMARWLALLAAATGRVLPAIDVLERHSVALAADDVQFLAMAMSVHSTTLPAGMQRGPIAEQIRQQRAGDNGGDREFERWVSLALGGSEQSFAEELCELLLLRDLPELGAHAEARAQRIETRFGPLGTLSRERAERRRAAGDVAGATSLLAAELVADPQDVVTLEALLPWLEAISDEAFAALPGAPARRRLTPARSALIEAEEARRASDPVRAEAAWQFAVDDPATRPLAQLALLRSAFTSGRGRTGLATAPWCLHADLAASTRAAGDSGDAAARSAAIVAVAHDPATDAATRRRLATIIDELSAPLAADVRRSLATALTARPGPWYGAFALLAGDLVTRAPDAAALQRIDDGLAAALAADGDGAPEAAIDAIVALVRASRRAGDSTRTDRWRDELAQRSAAHPLLLTELGFAALSAGDFTTADDRFELALALGGRDPEALSWLASRRLAVDGDPRAAVALATEAIKAAPARDQALLRASAGETSARASFVLGAFDASMASWSSAARERGDDPQSHVDCALEAFTRGLPAARDRLRKAADRDGPHQPLARRLLAVLEAAPKS